MAFFKSHQRLLKTLLILCFLQGTARSQGLYKQMFNGPYILLYKLDEKQVLYLTKNPGRPDTSFLFTRLAGKVRSDSIIPLKRFPNDSFSVKPFSDAQTYSACSGRFHIWDIKQFGYYLEVTVNGLNSVSYRLIENAVFQSAVHKIGTENIVFVQDSAGLPVSDAMVTLDTVRCQYDLSTGGYRIPGKKVFGTLKVRRVDYFTVQFLNGGTDKKNNAAPPADDYSYNPILYAGYLVTSKPRYKPWDTLHFKGFFVGSGGKPIREKVTITLTQPGNAHNLSLRIKPKKPGDYYHYFIVDDSFYTDQELTLTVYGRDGVIKTRTVYVENYMLNDVYFSVRADKQVVTPGAGLTFFANAINSNKLPVMDGRIDLDIALTSVNFTDDDSVVIPYARSSSWYRVSLQTDPSGTTLIHIPDTVFPVLDGTYYARFKLTTSDNDVRETGVQFVSQTTRDRLEAALTGDTLKVNRLVNQKQVRKAMRIKHYSRTGLIADSVFHTPAALYIPPNVYFSTIYCGDTLSGTFYRQTKLPRITGRRTHDSIEIRFHSQPDIPVYYRIYANNKLVASGHDTGLTWRRRDRGKNSYHLQYGILEGSVLSPRFFMQSFHLAEKQLSVKWVHPETIYPGQTVPIEIQVLNAYGKPLKKVNLAAWAVNSQLEGIAIPDVPYLGLHKPQKTLPMLAQPMHPVATGFASPLRNWQINRFFLYDNKVFNLVYPHGGMEVLTDTTPFKTTEVEFYLHGGGQRQQILYAMANDTLVQTHLTQVTPGVMRMSPGVYHLRVRTWDQWLDLPGVTIHPGKKNFIALNSDSLLRRYPKDTLSPGRLTTEELQMLSRHILPFRFDHCLPDTFVIRVNGKVRNGMPSSGGSYLPVYQVFLRNDLYNPDQAVRKLFGTQNFNLAGPFHPGDTIELSWKNHYAHQFIFEPGVVHSFTRTDHIRETNAKWHSILAFPARAYPGGYTLNAFWWDPYFKDTAKKQVFTNPSYPVEETKTLTEFVYSNYAYNGKGPMIYNSTLNVYLPKGYMANRMWLFNLKDTVHSVLNNGTVLNSDYPAVGLMASRYIQLTAPRKERQFYRMILFINDSLWAVKDLTIDSSTNVYLTLDPRTFRKPTAREMIMADRQAKNLIREPLRAWTDTPLVNKGLMVIPLKNGNRPIRVEGFVIGPDIKYPVDNAFVVLEQRGKYVQGAYTNREGRFVMDRLSPGEYMLKIKAPDYHYWIHYAVNLESDYNYILQARLKPFSWITYTASGIEVVSPEEEVYNYRDAYSANGASTSISRMDLSYAPSANYTVDATSLSSADMQWSLGDDKMELREVMVVSTEATDEKNSTLPQNDESKRVQTLAGDTSARRTRTDFRDNAFWMPSLYTNKEGKTGFTVRYPDNITAWELFAPAMDNKRHSGLGRTTVRSYKPIAVSMALPGFLTEGDSLKAIGRVFNYTGKALTGSYSFGKSPFRNEHTIQMVHTHADTLDLVAGEPGDSIRLESSFRLENGYRDAESRVMEVYPASVISGKSQYMELKNDTSLTLLSDSNGLGSDLIIVNQRYALILEILNGIQQPASPDLYSAARYLECLLTKKDVCRLLDIPFEDEKLLRQTISRIKKAQRNDALFGWFRNSKPSIAVTAAITTAMYRASQSGYENNVWLNASRSLAGKTGTMEGLELLENLICLAEVKYKLNYDSLTRGFRPEAIDLPSRLAYWRLKQLTGRAFPLEEVRALTEPTPGGNLKVPGTWLWSIAQWTDDAQLSFRTWQILMDAGNDPGRRAALLNYLVSESPASVSTLARAAGGLLREAQLNRQSARDLKPEILIDGIPVQWTAKPYKLHMVPGTRVSIVHRGAPVYLAVGTIYRTYRPVTDSTAFSMELVRDTKAGNRMIPGQATQVKVRVFARRTQYQVVVDIPVPAGCVYTQKIQSESPYESHREYQPGHVLVYFEELPFGYHTLTVPVMPKFTGRFHTAPARSALMFYPDKAGYTGGERWKIGD